MSTNPRLCAIKAVQLVVAQGVSLPCALLQSMQDLVVKDKPFCQALSYGMLRFYHRYQVVLSQWMKKPINDIAIELVLISGFYQLEFMRVPPHAVVNETVNLCKKLKKPWAANVVNALLRRWQREANDLHIRDDIYQYSHPAWFIQRLQKAWPEAWQTILAANNAHPQLQLRVNLTKTTRDAYLNALINLNHKAQAYEPLPEAIILEEAVDVMQLPGFWEGEVSVQAIGAQWAARLLDVKDNMLILDACAAPGGKTTHICALAPNAKVLAVDIDKARLAKVNENLKRLKVKAEVIAADIANLSAWHKGELFDRILLDAPCSATGVIGRHPDIKCLRRDSDIAALAKTQLSLLKTLWSLVKPGGILLYATCSVLPDENETVIAEFLSQTEDAKIIDCAIAQAIKTTNGYQLLPGNMHSDGFYYAKLQKPAFSPIEVRA